ncbi:MAG: hypothetical protein H7Y22_16980 [Gemmatimonadaceae bacterium]|nr:hypothetical protein [Gloeobacterales cyanobacterium ES-bin-141]
MSLRRELTGGDENTRVKASFIVWGCATGMMAISIPLTALAGSGALIPLGVLAAAATATWKIWQLPSTRSDQASSLVDRRAKQLEERLSNLETIVLREDVDLKAKLTHLDARE